MQQRGLHSEAWDPVSTQQAGQQQQQQWAWQSNTASHLSAGSESDSWEMLKVEERRQLGRGFSSRLPRGEMFSSRLLLRAALAGGHAMPAWPLVTCLHPAATGGRKLPGSCLEAARLCGMMAEE